MKGCAAIFGSGFAAGVIRQSEALKNRRLLYWGDIDTQGLRILSLVKESFPSCRSVLMDEETFDRFPKYRTDAPAETAGEPQALSLQELSLFRRLAMLEKNNRLEQERIPLYWVRRKFEEELSRLIQRKCSA